MSFLLPLVAIALAALSRFAFKDREPIAWAFDRSRLLALILATATIVVLVGRFAPEIDAGGLRIAAIVGALTAFVGGLCGGSLAPIGFGIASAAVMHGMRHTTVPSADLALLVGAGFAALIYGTEGAAISAIAAALCALGDNLGTHHAEKAGLAMIGSEMGLIVLVGALIAAWTPKNLNALKPIVVGLIAVIAAFILKGKLNDSSILTVTAIGAVTGVVLHWLLPDDDTDTVRLGIATVIGVAVATIAFGLGKGVGMAISLTTSAGILLAVGNYRALLTLGPLMGLVLYRVLREAGTGATRALDIGQHYALLGIVLGAVLPLLPTDWRATAGLKTAVGNFLWAGVLLAAAPLLVVMLGMKGSVGFVFGLGLAGLCQSLRKERSLLSLPLAAAIASATILVLGWVKDATELSRDEKVHFFTIAGVVIVVVAGAIALLARTPQTEGAK